MTYPIAADQAYYVVARDSGKTVPLAGPYASHGAAAHHVESARLAVRRDYPNDSRAHWAAYGVCLVTIRRPIRTRYTTEELAR